MNIYLIAIAVLPVIILAIAVYRQDKYEKEPIGKLIKAFIFGALSILPAALLESFLVMFTPNIPVVSGVYTGYVVAGASEELCKLLLLTLAIWRSKEFDEYLDGIVYSCFVALGFACFENLSYVFGQASFTDAMVTGSVRAVLSVPGHFLFGVMMGYYFALAKFDPERRGKYFLLAFVVPMLLHGTFDSLLMIPEAMGADGTLISSIFFIVFIYFDIKLWKIGRRRLRDLQLYDNYGSNYPQDPFSGFNWNV